MYLIETEELADENTKYGLEKKSNILKYVVTCHICLRVLHLGKKKATNPEHTKKTDSQQEILLYMHNFSQMHHIGKYILFSRGHGEE